MRLISSIILAVLLAASLLLSPAALCETLSLDEVLGALECIGSSEIYEEYKKRSLVIGREITVHGTGEPYEAVAEDITQDFALIATRDGVRERLFTGEVSIKLNNKKRG